jgi:hypothetical protein
VPGVRLVIDGARLATLLRGPTGVVWPHMMRRADLFAAAVRRQQPRRSGCLQDNTRKRIEEGVGGIVVRFYCSTKECSPTRTEYSVYVHEGTEAHVIQANFTALAFFWQNGPQGPGTYFFNWVMHPGTRPNKFFTDNLHIFTDAIGVH